MNNKYRINTNWSQIGRPHPFIYDVIVNLINELDKSLKTPIMQQSKTNEEVREILDNPAGITIEELQVINVWEIDKKLRREVRNRLDRAYRYLSIALNNLIIERNSMPNKARDKDIGISNENRKLKNTITNRYEAIKSDIKNYEAKESLSESERKLLAYIRKVYSRVLGEIVENVFSMATKNTERAEIFPFKEQEALQDELVALQEKIKSITEKNKQRKTDQQKENYEKLELEKKGLEKELTSLNSYFPNLIDSENKVNEEVQKSIIGDLNKLKQSQQQLTKMANGLPGLVNEKGEMDEKLLTLLTKFLAGVEKLESKKEERIIIPVNENSVHWLVSSTEKKRLENKLAEERLKSFQLKKKLDSLEVDRKNLLKQWEEIGQQMGNKAGKIKNELALIDYSELSAEELDNYLTELQEIKKIKSLIEILLSGATEEQISKKTIGGDEHEEFNKISDQLELERKLRNAKLDTKQLITNALADKWADSKGKRTTVIDGKELLKEEYRNYSETLDEMNDLNKIITFERKILQVIAKQRNEYQAIDECLSLGKKAIKSKNPKQIAEAYEYLSNFRRLQLEKKEKLENALNKAGINPDDTNLEKRIAILNGLERKIRELYGENYVEKLKVEEFQNQVEVNTNK